MSNPGTGDAPSAGPYKPALNAFQEVKRGISSAKWWIAAFTLAFTVFGVINAMLAPPVFFSEAILAPKESKGAGGASGLLSQFGGVGGLLSSQLGLSSNSLDRMRVMFKSRLLAEKVIKDNSLFPIIKAYMRPPKWKIAMGFKIPDTMDDAIDYLRESMLSISVDDKKNMVSVGVKASDSIMVAKIATAYLTALNDKLRQDVQAEADSNRSYLQRQIVMTVDPLLREKMQNLVATEFEKAMLVSASCFDVLDPPYVPFMKVGPKKRKIVMTAFFSGLFLSSFLAIGRVYAPRLLVSLDAKA